MTRRVIVTRAAGQARSLDDALRAHDIEPVLVPTIAVEIDAPGGPLDAAARALHSFSWAVVTSPNGARAIVAAAERVFIPLGTPSWAAIGDASAAVLEREGIKIDFRPTRADARTLAGELPVRPGQAVVLLRGDLAGSELPRRLRERGAEVADVVAYRTIEAPGSSRSALRDALAFEPLDAVLFASASAVRGLVALAMGEQLDVHVLSAICIGAETAREAERLGFDVVATSPDPDAAAFAATTAAALAEALEMR